MYLEFHTNSRSRTESQSLPTISNQHRVKERITALGKKKDWKNESKTLIMIAYTEIT